jgi:hypothetical protein
VPVGVISATLFDRGVSLTPSGADLTLKAIVLCGFECERYSDGLLSCEIIV